jgi:hypothetical protein
MSTAARPGPMWARHQSKDFAAMMKHDQVSLIVGDRDPAITLLNVLGELIGVPPQSVTNAGLTPKPARTIEELLKRLKGSSLLFDLEAFCWQPWLNADPLRFLRSLARDRGVIAVWPGTARNGVASFSAMGRSDYVSFNSTGLSILRPVPTRFPDEVPFTLERIP